MGLTYHLCVNLSNFVASNYFRLQIHGRENAIEEGPAILAMNHQSFLDPPLAALCCDRQLHFLARKTLFDVPLVGPLIRHLNVIGVDRDGTDMSALKTVIRRSAFQSARDPRFRGRDSKLAHSKANLSFVRSI